MSWMSILRCEMAAVTGPLFLASTPSGSEIPKQSSTLTRWHSLFPRRCHRTSPGCPHTYLMPTMCIGERAVGHSDGARRGVGHGRFVSVQFRRTPSASELNQRVRLPDRNLAAVARGPAGQARCSKQDRSAWDFVVGVVVRLVVRGSPVDLLAGRWGHRSTSVARRSGAAQGAVLAGSTVGEEDWPLQHPVQVGAVVRLPDHIASLIRLSTAANPLCLLRSCVPLRQSYSAYVCRGLSLPG